tara:strand:+ start:491 stop:1291 length:801 start_codon:yes stop_codon:yes gene_type:complete
VKNLIKIFMPSIFINFIKKLIPNRYGWYGDYRSWNDAENESAGYDSNEILDKVRNSLMSVKEGNGVFERDGILFDEIQYSWPLISGLMYSAAKSNGVINVLDFGGSLGSTYFQNKIFLDQFNNVSWNIVEQKHFVDVGKKEFENERLKFYYSTEMAMEKEKPNILLMLSVLQYIDEPYQLLEKLLENNFDHIIIDRTPFSKIKETIKIQKVTPEIYNASYPCWFFDESKLIKFFDDREYNVIESFYNEEPETEEYLFKGFIISKKC